MEGRVGLLGDRDGPTRAGQEAGCALSRVGNFVVARTDAVLQRCHKRLLGLDFFREMNGHGMDDSSKSNSRKKPHRRGDLCPARAHACAVACDWRSRELIEALARGSRLLRVSVCTSRCIRTPHAARRGLWLHILVRRHCIYHQGLTRCRG